MSDHSIDVLRRYYLTSEDRGVAGDTEYALVFTRRGEMVVRVTKHHEQQYKTPATHDIPARDFASTTVNHVPLLQIVIEKLNELLPKSN